MRKLLFTLLLFFSFHLPAQNQLVDLNRTTGDFSSFPKNFQKLNGNIIFAAAPTETGDELFISDGTPGGTHLIKDIYPGPESSIFYEGNIFHLTNAILGDYLYFTAYEPSHGYAVWRTNGHPDSTEVVFPNLDRPVVRMASDGNQLFFITAEPKIFQAPSPREFTCWMSDGTQAGTIKVKSGIWSMEDPGDLGVANGLFYFSFDQQGDRFLSLWRSDGTDTGTFPIQQKLRGPGLVSGQRAFGFNTDFNNEWYFIARDTLGLGGIWKTDGTANGTEFLEVVSDMSNGTNYIRMAHTVQLHGKLYLLLLVNNQISIWESEGTAASTQQIFSASSPAIYGISELLVRKDSLLFLGPGSGSKNTGIYMFDPQTQTERVHDGLNLLLAYPANSSRIVQFVENDADKWLLMNKHAYLPEIWLADDSTLAFQKDASIPTTGPAIGLGSSFLLTQNFTFFSRELGIHDGTLGGVSLLKNLESNTHATQHGFRSENPPNLLNTDSLFYFGAFEWPGSGSVLFQSNGTSAGTGKVINADSLTLSGPFSITAFQDKVILRAGSLSSDRELWITDGTPAGTQLLRNPQSPAGPILPIYLTTVGDSLYAWGSSSKDLWLTDGTPQGTQLVSQMGNTGFTPTREIYDMVEMQGKLYFTALSSTSQRNLWELWSSAGDHASTIRLDSGFVDPSILETNGAYLFFSAFDESAGEELWVTDGTSGGATLLTDIAPGRRSSFPENAVLYQNKVYFTADDSIHGREVWQSDGTPGGTQLLKDIHPGSNHSIIDPHFYVWKDTLFFQATDGTHGVELWYTTGTAQGTQMLEDIEAGPESSYPKNFYGTDSLLYFAAYSQQFGVELWQRDMKNPASMLADMAVGPENSNPFGMSRVQGDLLFFSDPDTTGWELYSLELNTVSIKKYIDNSEWNLYPNPTQDILRIERDGGLVYPLQVNIYNTSGQLVKSEELQGDQIEVSSLPSGIYVLSLWHNGSAFVRKFVKQ